MKPIKISLLYPKLTKSITQCYDKSVETSYRFNIPIYFNIRSNRKYCTIEISCILGIMVQLRELN